MGIVLYGSRGGNTKKVAEAIKTVQSSDNSGIFDISQINASNKSTFWEDNPSEVYFIGTGIYADRVDKEMREFKDCEELLNYDDLSYEG